MTNAIRPKDIVRNLFIDVFHKGDVDTADQILADDFQFQYPFPGFSPGSEGIKEFTREFHKGFPGFELQIDDLFEGEGEKGTEVAIRWTFRGKHSGDFMGVKNTEKYVTFSAIGIYVPTPGPWGPLGPVLSKGWLEMDTTGLLRDITVIKPINELLPSLRSVGDNPKG